MPVQITITGENAKEALQEIGGLASALVGATPAPAADKPAKPVKNPPAAKPAETKKEDPEKVETEDQDQGNAAGGDEEIPDDVKLRAAASEAAGRAGKPAVKALLDKYKVANVTAVPANKRLKFLEELEDLS